VTCVRERTPSFAYAFERCVSTVYTLNKQSRGDFLVRKAAYDERGFSHWQSRRGLGGDVRLVRLVLGLAAG
jgi:hypothetical protein